MPFWRYQIHDGCRNSRLPPVSAINPVKISLFGNMKSMMVEEILRPVVTINSVKLSRFGDITEIHDGISP